MPFGLAYDFSFVCENILRSCGIYESWSLASLAVGGVLAYFIFYVHYRLTCTAATRRNYVFLVVSLVLLLIACMIGWYKAPPVVTA
jgi:hypothetical protein